MPINYSQKTRHNFVVMKLCLDRHGLRPRDDVIASDLAFSRERSLAGGNPVLFVYRILQAQGIVIY